MTTIATWAAVDTRGVSSVYIASDSRISWRGTTPWDQGRKTFASHQQPYIFGYWGDVLFPAIALPQVIESIDHELIPLNRNRPYGAVGSAIRRLWLDYPVSQRRECGIVMAHRLGQGMRAVFNVTIFFYDGSTKLWRRKSIPMPETSAMLQIDGSGATAILQAKKLWDASAQSGTSRAVFSAFCEGLSSGKDKHSGGGPQLVGLRRTGPGRAYGIALGRERYFAGRRVRREDVNEGVDWYNELFERIDAATMRRLPGAQRHVPRTDPANS